MDVPTFDSLFAIARNEILIRNPKLSRDAVERDGADANAHGRGDCCRGRRTQRGR